MKTEVLLLAYTPDPEYQVVRAARKIIGTYDEIDSAWLPTGLKKAKTGGLEIEYPVMSVILGMKDKAVLDKLVEEATEVWMESPMLAASAAFVLSGLEGPNANDVKNKLRYEFMASGNKDVLVISDSFNNYFMNLYYHLVRNIYTPDLEHDDFKDILVSIGKELYKIAPNLFKWFK